MARTAIITDSTADFVGIHPEDFGVTVVPLTVNWGTEILRDKIDVTTQEFYERLRTDPTVPTTAAPPVGIFENLYSSTLNQYDDIISVHISGKLSATQGIAETAARRTDPDRIHVVDGETVSVTLGWLVVAAAKLANEGAPAADILALLSGMIPRTRLLLTLDTLEYLRRGGRIGRAQAFLGGLLNVKPVLEVRDGEVHPLERVRTRAAAVRRVAQLSLQLGPKEQIAVVHGDCLEGVEALRTQILSLEQLDDLAIAEIGSVLGTHAGPGVIGIGCVLAP